MPETKMNFEIKKLEIVDVDGNADASLEPKLSNDTLKQMYEKMALARAFDKKAFNLQRQGRSFTVAQMEGQEASQVGSVFALDTSVDWIFPTYREHAAMICAGMPLENMFLYWMGSEEGLRTEKNIYPLTIAIATHLIHAAGMGLAFKNTGKKGVTMPFFGDGATSEGDALEAFNFAGVFKTPTVFLCQNNYYAISVPLRLQTASKTLAQKAIAFGIEGMQVDGNDVLAVYSATKQAVERARKGEGATLLECLTYRFLSHTTADDPTKYRPAGESEAWRAKDPLPRFEKYLAKKGLWNEDYAKKVSEDNNAKIEDAVAKAEEKVKQLNPRDLLKHIWAGEQPAQQKEQNALLEEFLNEGI
ncbi:MAG: pyruvate dehydrogenase (acetyl-transferring) E1 component subunit alpha [Candidatus Norongarragalinales archaeon]